MFTTFLQEIENNKKKVGASSFNEGHATNLTTPLFGNPRVLEKTIEARELVLNGCILGANFSICEPTNWNGSILIYAHGYRPAGHSLAVELDRQGECYNRLVGEGWIVAATSYRREGVIIRDAMEDIKNLRLFISQRYGSRRTSMVILEGQSMGGGIATRLAEREPGLFDGVLGVGAALLTRKDRQSSEDLEVELLNRPMLPIIFLTNESELGPIEQYVEKVQQQSDIEDLVLPAVWTISRPGHNWTSQLERYSAIKALVSWLSHGTFITCRRMDGTRPAVCPPSAVTFNTDSEGRKSGAGRVSAVSLGGSLTTTFTAEDLTALGILSCGTTFKVSLLGDLYDVIFDEYPFVRSTRGEMIAFTEPDFGFVLIAIHNLVAHESASQRMGRARAGDVIMFSPSPRPPPGRLARETMSGGLALLGDMRVRFEKLKLSFEKDHGGGGGEEARACGEGDEEGSVTHPETSQRP